MTRVAARPPAAIRVAPERARTLALAGMLATALVALGGYRLFGRGGLPELHAVPDIARAAGAAVVLFGLAGYAPARVLLPRALQPHLPLLVLPVGAAVSALALTVLGALYVPIEASLAAILAGGAAGALAVRRRARPEPDARAGGIDARLVWPALVAAALFVVLASPMLQRDSFATVLGQNGDAHMATGAATLLQEAPPGATRPELPIDRMPAAWGSKYPIYYVLAGVSELSGLDPVQTIATVLALMGALVAVAFFLLAYHVLGASPAAALLAMTFVALDRIVLRLALDPYYNQLWALFAFALVLVAAWVFVREPGRGAAAVLALFFALALFAYPLIAPFPLLFMAVAIAIERRRGRRGWIAALRLPRGRRSLWLWIPAGIVLAPAALGLTAEASSKLWGAFAAVLPGGDLTPWHGSALPFHPVGHFLGLPDALLVLAPAVLALAAWGLWRAPRDAAVPLATVLVALAIGALWIRLRDSGVLFHFKALSFMGPFAVCCAALGLADLVRRDRLALRVAAGAATVGLAVAMIVSSRDQVFQTFPHVTKSVWELRDWNDRIPAGASVRVDTTPYGIQQWSWYMLADHPVNASYPLTGFFPYARHGRRADYVLVNARRRRPRDATGPPVLRNREFALYRMRAGVPGPDNASRELIDPLRLPGAVASGD